MTRNSDAAEVLELRSDLVQMYCAGFVDAYGEKKYLKLSEKKRQKMLKKAFEKRFII